MSPTTTKSVEATSAGLHSRGGRRGGQGRARGVNSCTTGPVPTAGNPSLAEVRAALATALAEADRPEELEEAVEAHERLGGLEGVELDQGRTVRLRVEELIRQGRAAEPEAEPADPDDEE